MPRLEHSDLPPNPAPYDGENKLLVLAYTMSDRHILWWAEKHNVHHRLNSPRFTTSQRVGDAVLIMRNLIPRQWKLKSVEFEDGRTSFAWAFITNTEDDLKLANDLKAIEKVRKVIRARGPPRWLEPLD